MIKVDYTCKKCGSTYEYSAEFDSIFCKSCNEWVESSCTDENCEFCSNRPETPEGLEGHSLV